MAAPPAQTDSTKVRPTVDKSVALVQLKGEPVTTYAKTKPTNGKKVNLNSTVDQVLSGPAVGPAQRLQAVAPGQRPQGPGDRRLGHQPQCRVGQAQRRRRLATLRTAPQAARVEYSGLYYPLADDPDLALDRRHRGLGRRAARPAPARASRSPSSTPASTSRHPCFDDAGYAAQTQLGDKRFTNNKVIAAKVFNNKAANQGLTRRGHRHARHARRRHGRLQLPDPGRGRRRRHPVRPVGRRSGGPPGQLQRLPGHGRERPLRGHPQRPRRRLCGRLRRRQHEPRRRRARHPGPADHRRRQPRRAATWSSPSPPATAAPATSRSSRPARPRAP